MARAVVLGFGLFALAVASEVAAVEVIPVYRGHLLGGQYFIKGRNASLSGNAALLAAPVLEFNERWSAIPMFAGNYNGTKGIGDGVGALTLFQQSMDHRVSFTGIYSVPSTNWKAKASTHYKRYFLKETIDETWGKGLFDYDKIGLGLEAENTYKDPFSYRIGFDVFRIAFPNYESLESKSGVDPTGNPLNRELASKDVLDTMNFQLTASASRPFPYDDPVVSVSGSVSTLYQNYEDQRLVTNTGQFQTTKPYGRQDFLTTASFNVGYPREFRLSGLPYRLSTAFTVNGAFNGSNQNTFDAAGPRFIYDAYSYYSYGFGPSASLSWGNPKRPTAMSLSFLYTRLQYTGRLAQDSTGKYLTDEHQFQDRWIAGLGSSYPILPNFNLVGRANFLWQNSNHAFEKTYLYTYRTANYMMGFTYEY